MKLLRVVLSDLHLGTGIRAGRLNPLEDFVHDERFAELLEHHDELAGPDTEVELIFNGDIFDLLKVRVDGVWPIRITPAIAAAKLRQCLEGHPRFVRALRDWLAKANRRLTYLPGNHDLDMWFPEAQDEFRRYVAPGLPVDKVRFITSSDTYYLPEGIQIRHGHQLERIHRVDYQSMTRRGRDGARVLNLPWGSLWILEVMNPAKELRHHVDRIQPLRRFLFASMVFDTGFALRFVLSTCIYFLKWRVFKIRAWRERLRNLPRLLREEVFALGGFDEAAARALSKIRGAHTLIVGHSHGARYRLLENGKTLINTGTWINMVNLDVKYLGQNDGLTYALIDYTDAGKPRTQLMRWRGKQTASEVIPYAD